jgi:excisionase family DNA binding protein
MAEPDELLTVADIAAELEMNQQTIRNWIESGYLPAIRIRRRVRVKRSDFDALLAGAQRGGGEVGRLTAMPTTLRLGASTRARAITGTARPEGWRIRAGSERITNRGRLGARS